MRHLNTNAWLSGARQCVGLSAFPVIPGRVNKMVPRTRPTQYQPIASTARNQGLRNPASVIRIGLIPAGTSVFRRYKKRFSAAGEPCCFPVNTMSKIVKVRPPTGTAARSKHQDLSAFKSDQSTTITGCAPRNNQRAMLA